MFGLHAISATSFNGIPAEGTPPVPGAGSAFRGGYGTSFELLTTLVIEAAFVNSDDIYVDPNGVVQLLLLDPNGSLTTVENMPRDGAGRFHYAFVPTVSGTYQYKFRGTGSVNVTSPDASFTVNSSTIIAG